MEMEFERFMGRDASKMILTPRHPVARQTEDLLLWNLYFCHHTSVKYAK
jgi:hypothetical protein